MPLGLDVGLGTGHTVLDGDPALPPQKGGTAPQFSAHVLLIVPKRLDGSRCHLEVGLDASDIVLDGDPAPPTLKRHSPQFSAHI